MPKAASPGQGGRLTRLAGTSPADIPHRHLSEIEQIHDMSQTTIAVLEQIKALSEQERRELIAALPSLAPSAETAAAGLDRVYEALA